MKAAVLKKINDMEYMEVDTPTIGEQDLLVKMKAASICGTDMRIYRGRKTKGVRYPSIIGHEFSGEVVQVGNKVDTFSVGDKICINNVLSCGRCYYCLNNMENVCENREAIGYEYDGAFAEYVRVPGKFISRGNIMKMPDSISWEAGALIEPLSCVINGQRKLNITPGDTVVVIGAGPIGLMHIMLAKVAGAKTVVVSEPNELRRTQSLEFGADIVVDPAKESLSVIIKDITHDLGADVVIVAIGIPSLVDEALALGRKGAHVSLFAGFPAGSKFEIDGNLIHYNELTVVGASALQRRDMITSLNLIESKTIDVEKLITHTYSLDSIIEAFEKAESGEAIKVIIKG
ncbi:MAG: zinc-dependent dehydrogenase [Sphaerochaetaceae bacterium]|jgi:L-iditol 2-dehydrogenase